MRISGGDFGAEAKALGLTRRSRRRSWSTLRVGVARRRRSSGCRRYLAELKADKDLGGANFERMTGLAIKGRDAFLEGLPAEEAEEIKGMLSLTGYGNNKALVRAFARLGKRVAEDKPLGSGDGDAGSQHKPGSNAAIAEKLYGKS
jgi:hypothetical protein